MASPNPLEEDRGLVQIHSMCANMDAIWRPTSNHDIGIDGQIEFLEPGTATSTGHILAVQSKSGSSYFSHEDDECFRFYPKEKHRRYWSKLKLPVILILHNSERNLTLYANVKPQLKEEGPIVVRKTDVFADSARDALLKIAEAGWEFFSPSEILDRFKKIRRERGPDQEINGIEFLLACTNQQGSYFELRMCRISALFDLLSRSRLFSTLKEDYEFIHRNVLEAHSLGIVEPFMDDFKLMWYDLAMVPDITVPLTSSGKSAITHLWEHLDQYLCMNAFSHLGLADPTEVAEMIVCYSEAASANLDRSDNLGETPR